MTLDRAGLRVLTRAECLHRLASVPLGRVALSWRAMPMILPVHFRVTDDEKVLVQAHPGTTLHRATDGTVVAFEAEGPPGAADPSWSVVVHGMATHLPPPWPDPSPTARIEIDVREVSGREFLDATSRMAPVVSNALLRW